MIRRLGSESLIKKRLKRLEDLLVDELKKGSEVSR